MSSHPATDNAGVIADLCARKPKGANFGIDRMRALVDALGHPERVTPCIHVAGTNGKGSVSAMLDSILRHAGWRCGLYTSPHLVKVGERVQVNRVPLADAEIVACLRKLDPVGEKLALVSAELRPSFFELMTAMAFLRFAETHCDIAVIEVGLGGRLDATNVVTPEVSVITSIAHDHCEILGYELEQIASEKAGIIKPGVPVVIGRVPREAETVIRARAAQLGAAVVSVAESYGDTAERLPFTRLEGAYQRWNAATASLAAQTLSARWRMTSEAVTAGLAEVEWSGRWQRTTLGGRLLILDSSHNSEGAAVLDANLGSLVRETGRAPIVITGVLGAVRAESLLAAVCRHAKELHLVRPNQPRACSFAELEALIPRDYAGLVVRDNVEQLFPEPRRCAVGGPDDVIVVTGSIYLLGEVMGRLRLETEE